MVVTVSKFNMTVGTIASNNKMHSDNRDIHIETNGAKNQKLLFHTLSESESERAIERFCQFVQFPTVSSIAAADGTYTLCATWLYNELINAKNSNDTSVFDDVFMLPEAPSHSPVVVALWKGEDQSLPILLLNSHYDVVPVVESDWTMAPPFSGRRQNGNIYGRGTQDMKCVCMQYFEAIMQIQKLYPNFRPKRSIYLSFVPDEGRIMCLLMGLYFGI